MREAYKLPTFSDIIIWNFNKTLTNNVDSFEQLGPDLPLTFGFVLEEKNPVL